MQRVITLHLLTSCARWVCRLSIFVLFSYLTDYVSLILATYKSEIISQSVRGIQLTLKAARVHLLATVPTFSRDAAQKIPYVDIC